MTKLLANVYFCLNIIVHHCNIIYFSNFIFIIILPNNGNLLVYTILNYLVMILSLDNTLKNDMLVSYVEFIHIMKILTLW